MDEASIRRIPKYLTALPLFLWCEIDEAIPLVLGASLAVFVSPWWLWLILGIVLSRLIHYVKERLPKGFVIHYLYLLGFIDFKQYPPGICREFWE